MAILSLYKHQEVSFGCKVHFGWDFKNVLQSSFQCCIVMFLMLPLGKESEDT